MTYKNYAFPVEEMSEFEPAEILGYRSGAAGIRRYGLGFDLGLFDFGGCQRRVISLGRQGKYFRWVRPNKPVEDAPWKFPTRDGLERLLEAREVTRLGPVGRGNRHEVRAE